MDQNDIHDAIKIVWDYMQLHQSLPKHVDGIIVLGGRDDRVASYAALVGQTVSHSHLIITGGSEHHGDLLEAPQWPETSEADHFATVLKANGYERSVLLEPEATNTGQNAVLSYAKLREEGVTLHTALIITKPYMERRALRTFEKQWPDKTTKLYVTSMGGTFERYVDEQQGAELVANIMVGDLERLMTYPSRGFMTESQVPVDVLKAYKTLSEAGYIKHKIQ